MEGLEVKREDEEEARAAMESKNFELDRVKMRISSFSYQIDYG